MVEGLYKKKQSKSPKNLLAKGERVGNALMVAKSMLMRGAKIEDIVRITGLSEKEIREYTDLSFSKISKTKIQLKLI